MREIVAVRRSFGVIFAGGHDHTVAERSAASPSGATGDSAKRAKGDVGVPNFELDDAATAGSWGVVRTPSR